MDDPSLPASLALSLVNLLQIATCPEQLEWSSYRPGVEVHRFYGDGLQGPSAALLRYQARSGVPLHEHTGYEHIFVLAGSQSDGHRVLHEGALLISPPGSRHRIVSEAGCIVLAIYEKPVRFLE